MTNEKGDPPQAGKAAADDAPEPARRSRGMSPAWTLLGLLFLIGVVLQHALGGHEIHGEGGQRIAFVVVGLAAFLLTLAAGFRPAWHRFLSSNRFSVPAILFLTLISVLGTLILQTQPQAVLERAYGSFAKLLQALFLDDVFHSLGFVIPLGAGAGGLALTIARRRKLTVRYTGALGAHLGLLLVLAGAAAGNVWVTKGRLNMHVGQTSDTFFVRTGEGMLAYPLGFSVRLDDFQLDMYEPEYRLMVFALEGNKEQRLASVDPADQADRAKLAEHGVEVVDYWPDHVSELVVEPAPADTPNAKAPAALGLRAGGEDARTIWVFDRGGPEGGQKTVAGKRLAFFWDEARAQAFAESQADQASPASAPHVLVVAGQEVALEAGKPVGLPNSPNKIQITQFFNDFVIDAETKRPANRSDEPKNPAVEVVVTDPSGKQLAKKFLFAKFPGFAHDGQDDPLAGVTYRYAGQGAAAGRVDWIVVGQTGQWWPLPDASEQARVIVQAGDPTPLPGKIVLAASHEAAAARQVDKTRSDEPNNPVVAIRRTAGGSARQVGLKRPLRISTTKALVLAPKGGESVRDYISTLSVVVDGEKVKTEKVEVNYPLEHDGYRFYQSDYRPDDPTFSGFQVVRDSGLWLVYLGFVVNMLGVLLAVGLPAILKRRKRLAGAQGGAS